MKVNVNLLRNICKYPHEDEYIEKLYDDLTGQNWWSDNSITNNMEREKFLYEAFIGLYDVINNGEVKETEKNEDNKEHLRFLLINRCKLQLEKEIERVRNYDYVKDEV